MNHHRLRPQLLTIEQLLGDTGAIYTVPIYQRNYAWQAVQIEQLLRDILDAIRDHQDNYFLGNLVVTERQAATPAFEVIDGQQRLTTLYLLLAFLAQNGNASTAHRDRLRYESRPRATEALRRVSSESVHRAASRQASNREDAGIHQGYNVIQQFMSQHVRQAAEREEFANFLHTKVTLVRASLPSKTDFNRYFEIMNTRGQQLQQTDIVKARLMQQLGDAAEQACFAWIWDACADMDSYVQMSLAKGNPALRQQIFGDTWSHLALAGFHELVAVHQPSTPTTGQGATPSAALPLDLALARYATMGVAQNNEDLDNVRFRSIIEFPAFLLQVLKVIGPDEQEDEGQLDDKALVKRFMFLLDSASEDKSQWVRDFAFQLLRCRNLFDSYILKRQYTSANNDEGDWSLQRLLKRYSNKQATPGYQNTFSRNSLNAEEDGDIDTETNDLLVLQSMLRVTYTSPRTMHWITGLLKLLYHSGGARPTKHDLEQCLRQYARNKVKEAFFAGAEPRGFSIHRIVFTYLDYLLWTDRPDREFRFSFRNSIEHFYPQNPAEQQAGAQVSADWLHRLGNLALVTVGANSKFSNSLPKAKAENFKGTIEAQSPKLQRMAEITRAKQWDDDQVQAHHTAMVERLRADLPQ